MIYMNSYGFIKEFNSAITNCYPYFLNVLIQGIQRNPSIPLSSRISEYLSKDLMLINFVHWIIRTYKVHNSKIIQRIF